ncbi:hypothetical protein KJ652_04310 [Patescibacteria group bacterium]|nr:hypothetical protein [Patescibacteria group bacterium]MBU1123790.1 hypothetical protein [Patescibacteria group bacterium]MBU1911089.1 hypothetical protein [Patescibacteria group bacterium]
MKNDPIVANHKLADSIAAGSFVFAYIPYAESWNPSPVTAEKTTIAIRPQVQNFIAFFSVHGVS